MAISSSLYMHESDRSALQALKAIPGFAPLMKAFMKVWGEQQFYIQNMATNLRISEKQLPKYYNMLPPICEKLGIEVPELYLQLDVTPNAYTYGDTKPFIVLTSGLLETMPEELIPTILAHECGHIACHHVLYHTMGRMILSGANDLFGLGDLITFPIQCAFYYWMRRSELSADRAAAICDGTGQKMIETCMRFAGYNKDVTGEGSVEAFLEQAVAYREMVNTSKWNKTLEFLMFSHADHPLNAVRAYECNEWQKSEGFAKIMGYMLEGSSAAGDVPVPEGSRYYTGKNCQNVIQQLRAQGFENIETIRDTVKNILYRPDQVTGISIDGRTSFEQGEWFPAGAKVVLTYYRPLSEQEIQDDHPGEIRVPNSSRFYTGRKYRQVAEELRQAGFTNISVSERYELKKSLLRQQDDVVRITIDGFAQFEKGSWFRPDVPVQIIYCNYSMIDG